MEQEEFCPFCGESFRGSEIPQEYIDKGYYEEDTRYYSTKLGIQVQGQYDGVLIWKCEKCNHMWPRFSKESWETMHNRGLKHIQVMKEKRK